MRERTWIALFRGINVGGHGRLPMKELVGELEDLGHREVRTYIQSGNAVFSSTRTNAARIAAQIEDTVEEHHGFRPRVMVLSHRHLHEVAAANPFTAAAAEPKTLHAFFLAGTCKASDLSVLDALKTHGEEYLLAETVFYLHTPGGFANSKLAAKVERALGVPTTARNWRSVTKILELAAQVA